MTMSISCVPHVSPAVQSSRAAALVMPLVSAQPVFGSQAVPVRPITSTTQSMSASAGSLWQRSKDVYHAFLGKEPIHVVANALVLGENGQFSPQTLTIIGQRVYHIGENPPMWSMWMRKKMQLPIRYTDAKGMLMTPGLIDQHNHGALGVSFDSASPADIAQLMRQLPAYGVTGVLPTLTTNTLPSMQRALSRVDQVIAAQNAPQASAGHTRLLGVHLEGPFLSEKYPGTHNTKQFQAPTFENMRSILSPNVRIVTMAIEKDKDYALTRQLTQQGVRVQVGHSAASYEQVAAARAAGLAGATHLYNQMQPLHHRRPGVVGAALALPGLKSELVADGHHVHPEVMKMTIQARPNDIILQTDSMYMAGLPDGQRGMMAGKPVVMQHGKVFDANTDGTSDGNMSGSSVFLNQCVQNLAKWRIADFGHAVNMASKHPAQYLGFADLGQLRPTGLADFVLWNPKTLDVEETYIAGEKVYDASRPQDAALKKPIHLPESPLVSLPVQQSPAMPVVVPQPRPASPQLATLARLS